MEETKTTTEEVVAVDTVAMPIEAEAVMAGEVAPAVAETAPVTEAVKAADPRDARRPRGKSPRSPRPKFAREKPEFDSKMISIRRVTRVVSGGRRFSLSVAVIAGDRNGRIGLGTGKAQDTQLAIEKAMKQAKRNMFHIKLTKKGDLPHDIGAKYKSAKVDIMPNKGKGLIAGSSARVILSLAGIKNATAKYHSGTKNKLNNARATMKALQEIAYAYGEAPTPVVKMPEAPVEAS
jgi:small subunit ribosomal protein S5